MYTSGSGLRYNVDRGEPHVPRTLPSTLKCSNCHKAGNPSSSFNNGARTVESSLVSFARNGTWYIPRRIIAPRRYLQKATMPPFNKMFVMIPVMLAARKLDGEDPNVVHMVRVAYGVVQLVCFLLVAYAYVQATLAAKSLPEGKIYIPQAAMVRFMLRIPSILLWRKKCFIGRRESSRSLTEIPLTQTLAADSLGH